MLVTNRASLKYYVGKRFSELEELQMMFIKKCEGSTALCAFPEKRDVSVVNKCDIILLLGQPITVVDTKREASKVLFHADLAGFEIE